MDVFKQLLGRLGKDPAQKDVESIAHLINVTTGRVGIKRLEKALNASAHLFFGPQLTASRFQYALGTPLMAAKSAASRKVIAQEYVRYIAGVAAIGALAKMAGAEVGTDPHSTDFGKLIVGDRRVDITGGVGGAWVFTTRMVAGKRTAISGKETDLDKVGRLGYLQYWTRTKLAPLPAQAGDALDRQGKLTWQNAGKNVIGEQKGVQDFAEQTILPMSVENLVEAARTNGWDASDFLSLLDIMGFSTFEKGPIKRPPPVAGGGGRR